MDVADFTMAVTKELLIAIAVAIAVGAAWTVFCVALGWPLLGILGVVLGAIVGSAACVCLRADASPLAGMLAAVVAMALVLTGATLEQQGDNRGLIAAVESDDSHIAALAEQIAWERATPQTDDQGQPRAATTLDAIPASVDRPPGISPAVMPAEIREAAVTRWQSMPAEEKQKFRDERKRWMTQTLGPELNRFERTATGWPLGTVAALAGVAAMLSAAWPALVGRYLRGDR